MSGAELSALLDRVKALEQSVERIEGRVPPSRMDAIAGELVGLRALVEQIDSSVDDLLHGEADETAITLRSEEPEIRVRISHAHTLKDGWRCDGTTVEWTGRGPVDFAAIRKALGDAHVIGAGEAALRNTGVSAPEAAAAAQVA